MTTIRRLKSEALASCRYRGHDMGRFRTVRYCGNRVYAVSTCAGCGKQVAVTPKPDPNDIQIGGEAVALGCEQ